MKKTVESRVFALNGYNEQKKQNTAERVNKAIDTLMRKKATINFETVAKAAGVSRATLYNNPKLKERIMGLRAIASVPLAKEVPDLKRSKVQRLEETVADLKARVRQLEMDNKKLIAQLVDYEETKAENERLKRQLLKGLTIVNKEPK